MKYTKQMNQVLVPQIIKEFKQNPESLVQEAEEIYRHKIEEVCDEIIRKNTNVILLTGPSASGKTTSAKQIVRELERRGKKSGRISLDNFYKNNEDQPHWSDGRKNFETIESLDVEYFNQKVREVLDNGTADFPLFDFTTGRRSKDTFPVLYDEETYLIFEGIHALNPLLCEHLQNSRIMRIYVSVHSDFVDGDGNIILRARDLRFLRRLLRDSVHRDSDALETLELWQYVLRGEKLYIKPFRKCADFHLNSAHRYEPFLYKERAIELLKPVAQKGEFQELVQSILNSEAVFVPLSKELIPKTSLIQEFI